MSSNFHEHCTLTEKNPKEIPASKSPQITYLRSTRLQKCAAPKLHICAKQLHICAEITYLRKIITYLRRNYICAQKLHKCAQHWLSYNFLKLLLSFPAKNITISEEACPKPLVASAISTSTHP